MVKNTIELQKELSRLDSIIGGKYLGDDSPVPEDQLHIAYMWLENDIGYALYQAADMDAIKTEIETLLASSKYAQEISECVSVDKAYRRANIRKDFASALENAKTGRSLSGILDWSFSDKDLCELAKLHKANRYRKKIEDLLEDCNFHAENGDFQSGRYEKYLKEVSE